LIGQERGEQHQSDHRQRAGEKRTDRGDAERRPTAALLGQGIAVQTGRHGGDLTGDIEQDGSRRTAVHGAIVDARHEDNALDRRQHSGQGQQDGDRRGRPEPRQHPNQRAD